MIKKNTKWRLGQLFLCTLLVLGLSACSAKKPAEPSVSAGSVGTSQKNSEAASSSAPSKESVQSQTSSSQAKSVALADIPPYSGQPFVEINNNEPFFEKNEWTTSSFQHYFDLDNLGRVTGAYASLGSDLMPTEKRGDISSVRPTGFLNKNIYPFVDGERLYNRCHLIGFQLAGQNANPKNLMTGTRYMNVDGMLPFENMVADYIKDTNNHVMYRVTPMFEGDDLVAKGVLMEAQSVEDEGDGISFNVFCYNVQPGVAIAYTTGENQADGSLAVGGAQAPEPEVKSEAQPEPAPQTPPASGVSYVANTNSMKFHYPTCSSVEKISAANRWDTNESRDQLIASGYSPCKICHP